MAQLREKGPLCECGCGEHLPIGSTRKYKRGHRARVNKAATEKIDRELGIFDGYQFQQYPMREDTERIDSWDTPEITLDDTGTYAFTIEDAAASTPNDPDSEIWKDYKPGQELPFKAIKDIEGKLAFMLGSTAGLVNVIDPVCGDAFMKSTKAMAKSLTPILCQSPGIVAWFGKTSNIMLYVNLIMASWPVLSAVYTHHFSKHEENSPNVMNGQTNINPNMYAVS